MSYSNIRRISKLGIDPLYVTGHGTTRLIPAIMGGRGPYIEHLSMYIDTPMFVNRTLKLFKTRHPLIITEYNDDYFVIWMGTRDNFRSDMIGKVILCDTIEGVEQFINSYII